jgi:hypothetical protein
MLIDEMKEHRDGMYELRKILGNHITETAEIASDLSDYASIGPNVARQSDIWKLEKQIQSRFNEWLQILECETSIIEDEIFREARYLELDEDDC